MIGDVLTSSILFEALKDKYPQSDLHYLVQAHTIPVLENNPFIDQLIIQEKSPSFIKLLKQVKKEKYDVIIDVYAKINSALISTLSGVKKRISYHKWYTSAAYTKTFKSKRKPETSAGLAIENRMLLLKGLSPEFPEIFKPQIYLSEEEKITAKKILAESGVSSEAPLFMISILGSSSEKTYPPEFMVKIIDFIVSETGAQLLFNYIPKQEKEALEIFNLCSTKTQKNIFFNVFGKNLREFLTLTSCCNALIGNEGGAVNMAKALDIPTFAIFSPQISKQAWFSNFEGIHMAVHLKDYKPEIFRKKIKEKGEIRALYQHFTPELFLEELKLFLNKVK